MKEEPKVLALVLPFLLLMIYLVVAAWRTGFIGSTVGTHRWSRAENPVMFYLMLCLCLIATSFLTLAFVFFLVDWIRQM